MRVKEIMTSNVVSAREDATLEDIARTMLERGIGAMPVIDGEGKLSGLITESDFTAKDCGVPFSTFRAPKLFGQWLSNEGCERIYEAARKTTAKRIMTRNVMTIGEDESVEKLLEMMLSYDLKRIPVVRDGALVGLAARHDVLKMMLDKGRVQRAPTDEEKYALGGKGAAAGF